jgi:NADP-dependent 3-hydroxy acid dehydrogenase YdfG
MASFVVVTHLYYSFSWHQFKMSQQLKNKNIVIIGGTTGIGLSAAKAFIAEGAKVVVVGRNADSVAEAKKY